MKVAKARKALHEALKYLERGALPGGDHETDAINGDGPLTPSFASGAAQGAIAHALILLGDSTAMDAQDKRLGLGKYRKEAQSS